MLRQGPIPVTMHAAIEPLIAVLFIAAPFLFGFSDNGAATAVSIIAGIAVLLLGMSTQWRISLVKLVPLSVHAVLDLGLGALLIAAPFLFGFSDETAPTIFFLAMGVGLLLASLGTAWDPAAERHAGGRRTAAVR